ncbi:MAG: apolipoprotein N-acyltransferase [Clostridia bacterium]|nr:apolipoprotein N-acyltransferase [Clostridia bacterium]
MIWILLILGGVLTALTQMVEWLSPLAFLSMIPAVIALCRAAEQKLRFGKVYLIGLAFALPYFLTVFHWFFYLYPMEFLGVSEGYALLIVLTCWLGLSLLQGTSFACFGIFFRQCSARPKLMPILFATVWTFSEWLQTLTWAGVPWARLALSQTHSLAMIQSANLFGSLFVGFLIALVNGILGYAVYRLLDFGSGLRIAAVSRAWKRLIPALGLSVAIVAANLAYGTLSIVVDRDGEEEADLSVGLIQGNIASGEKWDADAEDPLELHLRLSEKAVEAGASDLILWAETVINYPVKKSPYAVDRISAFAVKHGVHLFVGTFDRVDGKNYNAILCFFPDGSVEESPYGKQHLVPFGEYLPMEDLIRAVLPQLAGMNMYDSPISPGEGSAILDTEYGKIGRLVCFDSIYEPLARKSTADGAQILLLSTNDSWYLDSPAVYQHNAHAQLRAVENGRAILRAANTGISSLITRHGEVTDDLDPLVEGVIVGTATTSSHRTLYSYIGDLWVALCFGFMLFEAGTRIGRWVGMRREFTIASAPTDIST